jgi:hypothetical protein
MQGPVQSGLDDLHFHDLRGTAVTRLALAGCTVPQIAAITGHSLRDVEEILDTHYLGGKAELAEAAIIKLAAAYGVSSEKSSDDDALSELGDLRARHRPSIIGGL